jgi:general secretion pathway protein D
VTTVFSGRSLRRQFAAVALAVGGCLTNLRVDAQGQPAAQQPTALNFSNARLADVIRTIAASLGLTVMMTDVPDVRITFSTAAPVRQADLGDVLESILESNGLMLVQKGPLAQVLPAAKAPPTGRMMFGNSMPDPPPVGLVTQLVPLESIRADEGLATLKQIAAPGARIEAIERSNSLLITDRGSNVARYLQLLRKLDERPQGESGLRTYVVPLKYANSEDLANTLGQTYGVAIVSAPGPNLADRSLTSALGLFREREMQAYSTRRDIPLATGAIPAAERERGDTAARTPGALVGRTTVVPNPPTNSLIIRTAPPNFPLLRETIDALDTRPAQVLFEVTVAEITLGRGDEFGIDWTVMGGSTTTGIGNPSQAASDSAQSAGNFIVRVVTLNSSDVRAVLRALASKSQVRVLSTPELLAVNNREARILVGSKVPFVAATRLGNDIAIDRTVQFQDVGTALTIIPTINNDDYVSVQLLQEVSSLTNQTIQAALNAPVISTREASTRAVIRDGQTVVIGGLIGNSREDIESGIPFFKDLPLLGYLFKRKSVTLSRNELAIFVTPYIVRSDAQAETIRERIRRRMNDKMPGTFPDTTGVPPKKP